MTEPTLIVRPAKPSDLEEVIRLKSMQDDTGGVWWKRYTWQFIENPAKEPDQTIGWVAEAEGGKIAGYIFAIPQRYRVLGTDCGLAFGSDLLCHPDFRGRGLARLLLKTYMETQVGRLAITTTALPVSGHTWLKISGFKVGDLHLGFLFPYRFGPLVREYLSRRWPRLPAKSLLATCAGTARDLLRPAKLPKVNSGIEVTRVEGADDRLEEIWRRHMAEYAITAVRDRIYREWRYERAPEPRPTLWLVTDRARSLGAWFATRVKVRGQERQIRVCEVLDVFGPLGEPAFQREVLAAAIRQGADGTADTLEVKGLHVKWRRHFDDLGCLRRTFPFNPFLASNYGNFDDVALHDADNWHICPADGDASL